MRSFTRWSGGSLRKPARGAASVAVEMAVTISGFLCLACAASSALAQSDFPDTVEAGLGPALTTAPRPTTSLELDVVDPAIAAPTGTTARLYRLDQTTQSPSSHELHLRLWWGKGVGSMGAGTDWAIAPAGSSLRPLRPVLGVRANLSDQARLIYELRGATSALASINALGATDPQARLALEFKSANNPAQHLRNGLFRIQLSNSSTLFIRPRNGGLGVSYRSQF